MSLPGTSVLLLALGTLLVPQAAGADTAYSLVLHNQQSMELRLQEIQPMGMSVSGGSSVCDAGVECRWELELLGSAADFPGGRSLFMYFLGGEGQLGVLVRLGSPGQGVSCMETPVNTSCQGTVDSTAKVVTLTVSSP